MATQSATTNRHDLPSRALLNVLVSIGFGLALVSLLAALLAGLGHRAEWWNYRFGLTMLRWAAWGGVAATALSLLSCVAAAQAGWKRGLFWSLGGIVLGCLAFVPPWYIRHHFQAQGLPPIHDITTDTADPPRFVAILPLRKGVPNPAEYGGAKTAALQKKGYPDIVPLLLKAPPRAVFDQALSLARDSGWEIVADVPEALRIEATARTLLFGFKDDIVIRITPNGSGSRVDMRSVSRVGRSDFGTNARRVRDFLRALATKNSLS